MQPQVYAGWRVILKINDQLVAAGFVMDYSIDTVEATIQGIDSVFPDEFAPQSIMVNMNLRVYRTPNNDPVALGIAPGGDSSGADRKGLGGQKDFTESPYITIEVRDRITDKTIIYLPKAWLTKRSGSAEAETLMTETWSIKSIGYFGPGQQVSGVVPVLKNIFS